MRTTKEDVEDASGEGEQQYLFGEKGCHESSEMESGSWRDWCQSGVNLATSRANSTRLLAVPLCVVLQNAAETSE